MVAKKYSSDFIMKVVKESLANNECSAHISRKYKISNGMLQQWLLRFKYNGEAAFSSVRRSYSTDFKIQCVQEVLQGLGTVDQIAAKHNLSAGFILRTWIKKYNSNMELKDFNTHKEDRMAKAKRDTSLEERIEIVNYCIENGCNYKNTAAKFNVSYTQVYNWVKKFKANPATGLQDRRGHHKSDDEVGELERLRRENNRLKQQLKEKEMLFELLKKAEEFERM